MELRTQLIRLPGGENGCGSGGRDGIDTGDWKPSWDGMASSAKDCGGLAGMPGWGRETRARSRSPAGGRGGVFVWAGRRDHEGELDRPCVREGCLCSAGRRDLVYIDSACPSAPPRSLRNLPKPWSISSRLMLAPPASMTARTLWLLSAAPRAMVRLTRVPSAKAVER